MQGKSKTIPAVITTVRVITRTQCGAVQSIMNPPDSVAGLTGKRGPRETNGRDKRAGGDMEIGGRKAEGTKRNGGKGTDQLHVVFRTWIRLCAYGSILSRGTFNLFGGGFC